MSSRWYLSTVRHGETDYNKQKRYAGSLDVALNGVGRSDARLASERVNAMQFDVVISSPLSRAVETARILTEGSLEVIPCHFAEERHYGILEGLSIEEVERIRPPIHFIKVGNDYHSLDPPGAETFLELRARAERLHRHIVKHFKGRRVLLVAHGVFLQQFHGSIRGQDWIEALGGHVGNLEMTTFGFEDDALTHEEKVHLVDRKQSGF